MTVCKSWIIRNVRSRSAFFSVYEPIRAMPINQFDWFSFIHANWHSIDVQLLFVCKYKQLPLRRMKSTRTVCHKVRAIEARFGRNVGRRPSHQVPNGFDSLSMFLCTCLWELIARVERRCCAVGLKWSYCHLRCAKSHTHQGWYWTECELVTLNTICHFGQVYCKIPRIFIHTC